MNNLFRGLLAGYGAKKLGGGCFSTVLIFVVLWVLLGQCGATYAPEAPAPASAPAPAQSVEAAPPASPAVALVPAG